MALKDFRFRIADCGLKERETRLHADGNQQHLHRTHTRPGGRCQGVQVSAIHNQQSGQASVWAILALLVLVMVGAALLDAYQWVSMRIWAYHAAEAAAERGVTAGADWTAFQSTGQWRLDTTRARTETENALRDELSARGAGLSRAAWDIRIHPTSALVTETGWPPRGSLWGDVALPSAGWTTDRPSIGVYLEVDAPTFLGSLAGIRSWARIHVFASSSLVR